VTAQDLAGSRRPETQGILSRRSMVGWNRGVGSAGCFDQPAEIVDTRQRKKLLLAEFAGEPAFDVMNNLNHAYRVGAKLGKRRSPRKRRWGFIPPTRYDARPNER